MTSRKEREAQFNGLVAFANLGNTVGDWRLFRLKNPHFFPETPFNFGDIVGFHDLTDWLYTWAEEWAQMMQELTEEWEKTRLDANSPKLKSQMPTTPLLWYRNRLRAVWARNDPDGINLMILYGLEEDAMEKARRLGSPVVEGILRHFLPGEQSKSGPSIGGLPPARTDVDGTTGEIRWEFACQLQSSVRELMKQRWRAMICPTCGKFFVADKSAQKHCSTDCYTNAKRKQALDRWKLKGNLERKARRRKARPPGSKRSTKS